MNCPYCNEPADQLDSIVKLPNGDRVHFRCSDKMLEEWQELKAKLEQIEKALELAEKIIIDAESLFDGLQTGCVNVGDIRYSLSEGIILLTKAKEALNG